VMIVYNNHPLILSMTEDAIESVERHTVGPWELILIWQGELEDLKNRQHVRVLPRERGDLAALYNEGFSYAKGDVFCVMHNDVLVPFGWNQPLEFAAMQFKIAFPMIDETGSFSERRGIKPTEPDATTGACFAMSRGIWNQLGGYDEGFKGYHGEDVDLFLRAHKLSIPLVRVDTTVIHHRGATRSLNGIMNPEEMHYFDKNMAYLRSKWGEQYVLRIAETPQEPTTR
jgi:glycosyltransferase involved in cell wall biosynthesis